MKKEEIKIVSLEGVPPTQEEQETMVGKVWNQFLRDLGEKGEGADFTIELTKFSGRLFGFVTITLAGKVLTFIVQYDAASFEFKQVAEVGASEISKDIKDMLATK